MVFIFTALYPEAKPLIKMFGLKKRTDRSRFQQFVPEDYIKAASGTDGMEKENKEGKIKPGMVLAITGVGPVNAAAAVSSVLTEYNAGSGDQLLSFGTAAALHGRKEGSENPEGTMFLLNKLLDQNSDRCFYPDMLIDAMVPEASAVTGSSVLSERAAAFMDMAARDYDLYDMEAAAVYQTGAFYMGPHQMSFMRVVTDMGVSDNVSDVRMLSDRVTGSVEKNVEQILGYVEKLREISLEDEKRMKIFGDGEEKYVEKVIADAHFSKVMKDSFTQYVKYAALSGINWRRIVEKLYDEGVLPTIDKRNGKKVLDVVRNVISE
ncbi:hypothetical protein [Oribacterium sp. P6A1]|uniref:hypothetical protein n=1 Tax=Oribacterium sp. P6A1 TaxID=1410612 RepID=UPI00055E3674|nr:hypothetical protein [Oribacterium sp. P6A1]